MNALFLLILASFVVAPVPARQPGSTTVAVFSIAKSENKNQVQYVVRVDDRCAPSGPAPVSAYWRMLEKGPTQTAPLLSREVRAYGLANQTVVSAEGTGGEVRAVLNALPSHPLRIVTERGSDGACRALATTTIAGAPAHLFNVYVHVRWYGADYVLLQGWSMDGTHVLREKVK